jgi:type I restriction enzyme, S subunit
MSLETIFHNFALLSDASNGVAKLRELVLQLAVEGKLVPQNSSDEPASKLLQRIKANKERLAKEQKTSKEEEAQTIQKGETPFAVPDDWEWVRLSQITNAVHYGYTASANHSLTDVRLLRITDIQNGKVDWASVPGCEIDKKKLKGVVLSNNDVLIARTGGTIGKSYLVQNLDLVAVFASYLIRAVPNENLFARYLKLFLESELYWSQLYEKSMGTGQPNVNATSLKSLLVPLPPLEEQKRIVARVDELMKLCDELEARQQAKRKSRVRLNNTTLAPLNNAASLVPEEFEQASARLADNFAALYDSAETVSKLRSTILQLAVQGKLILQNANDEPASVLVERVKKKKAHGVRDSKIKNVEQLPSINEDEIAVRLPKQWRWTRLAEVCDLITKGSSPKWQGVNYVGEEEGVLFVTSENIGSYRMIFEKRKHVEARFNEIEPRSILQRNDVLMNIVGGSIGRTALFDSDELANINQAVCLIRVADGALLPYLLHFFNSETCIQMMFDKQVDNARANLSMGNISKFPIPLPPLEEQKRIVAQVNQLMALCDELETKLRQAEADSEKLMNAAVRHVLASIRATSNTSLAGAST